MGAMAGLKADGIIDGQHLVFRESDFRPVIQVQGVAVGDDGIERVIAPGQLEDHQHMVFGIRCHRVSSLCL